MIPDMLYIHLAAPHTQTAAVASVGIHSDACHTESVEKAIDRAKRAEKAAEGTITERAGESDDQHDHPLLREKKLQLIEGGGIGLILQQPDCTLQRTGRADVLAKSRQRDPLIDPVPDGNCDYKHHEHHILQV